MKTKILSIIIVFVIAVFLFGCGTKTTEQQTTTQTSDEVVVTETYFSAWDEKDYATMYSLISDGFKVLEPTAATEESFAAYAAAQGIDGVEIVSLKETGNTETTATVEYSVVFSVANKKVPYTGAFTLKYKPKDSVPGWKLIHPYGENIDTS